MAVMKILFFLSQRESGVCSLFGWVILPQPYQIAKVPLMVQISRHTTKLFTRHTSFGGNVKHLDYIFSILPGHLCDGNTSLDKNHDSRGINKFVSPIPF